MKKTLFIALFFMSCCSAFAQYGVQVSYLGISGPYAYTFKPSYGVEIFAQPVDIDDRVRISGGIGYYKLKATQDTFYSYAITNTTPNLVPSTLALTDYTVIPIFLGAEYHPFDWKISPFVGLDAYFYIVSYSYQETIPGVIDLEDDNETEWAASIYPKIGVSYRLADNFLLSAGFGLSIGLTGTTYTQDYAKTFLKLTYCPED